MRIMPTTGEHSLIRLVGLLGVDGDRLTIETEYGLPEVDIYWVPYPVVRSFLTRGIGTGYGRRHRVTRWEFAPGRIAYVLPRLIEATVTLADLCRARDWVESHGATFGSVQGTAMSLLRVSLDKPMDTAYGGPPLEKIAGGRIHSAGHQMTEAIEVWDIRAAFASTLSTFRPCGIWYEGRKLRNDTADEFVTCTIQVPYMAQWGPLPVIHGSSRPRIGFPLTIYPQDRELSGTWTGDEI